MGSLALVRGANMTTTNKKPSGGGNGGSSVGAGTPLATVIEAQQRQAQALIQANLELAEGLMGSAASMAEAASMVVDSLGRRAATGEFPFVPLPPWPLDEDEETRFEDATGRSVGQWLASAQKALRAWGNVA